MLKIESMQTKCGGFMSLERIKRIVVCDSKKKKTSKILDVRRKKSFVLDEV